MPSTSFSCLVALARPSSTVLEENSEGRSFLCHNLRQEATSHSPVSIMLAVGFFFLWLFFISLKTFPSIPIFLRVLSGTGVEFFSSAFYEFIDMIRWVFLFFRFSLLLWRITWTGFWIVNEPCIPRINPTWSQCIIFCVYCWILFAPISLRTSASILMKNVGL